MIVLVHHSYKSTTTSCGLQTSDHACSTSPAEVTCLNCRASLGLLEKTSSKAVDALFCADQRLSYRRLLAFAAATVLLFAGLVDQTAWLVVAGLFVGTEGAERVARAVLNRSPGGSAAASPERPHAH